jgi:hypothetical protein
VGEVVDKIVLKPVKHDNFLVINKNDEYSQQNQAHQQTENQNDQPGLGLEDLAAVQVEILNEGIEALADGDVPVNIEK